MFHACILSVRIAQSRSVSLDRGLQAMHAAGAEKPRVLKRIRDERLRSLVELCLDLKGVLRHITHAYLLMCIQIDTYLRIYIQLGHS